jgi:hypothetical protein
MQTQSDNCPRDPVGKRDPVPTQVVFIDHDVLESRNKKSHRFGGFQSTS